ncbi:hypothetical protein GOP47_0026256 [Adiantum capillus-veneris]|nr:hypothetical protein GOP47_0026256 [Adiantum capillus-veneris]
MDSSVLEVVGLEIVGIVCPVSICMFLVVVLVKELQTQVTDTALTSVASLIYSEESTDSDWTKFLGALINAGVFVLVITLVTFLLVLLFYFRCTKCLRAYTALGAFTILAYMGGNIAVMLVQELEIPIDAITASIILYNFAIVGVLSVFFCKVPIMVTQGYLILVGTLVAFWFTSLPEWTTWVLLIAISLYDVVSVLVPGGPLNILVQLAMSRDEEIPALIYEARPVTTTGHRSAQVMTPATHADQGSSLLPDGEEWQGRFWKRRGTASNEGSTVLQRAFQGLCVPLLGRKDEVGEPLTSSQRLHDLSFHANLGHEMPSAIEQLEGNGDSMLGFASEEVHGDQELRVHNERAPLVLSTALPRTQSLNGTDVRLSMSRDGNPGGDASDDEDEGIGLGASGAIKLGLGDFIFYSVLVGRAALYDMTTVYASYLAIITGLGATLGLLAVWRRALPALPISIALGIVFYFLTRFLMEPFVMNIGGNLIFM